MSAADVLHSRRSYGAALVAIALALLIYGLTKPARLLRVPAPALPTRALSGAAVTLAQLRGHPAALVFWASWCTDCHREAAAVERFARSAAGHGRVVAIDYSDGGDWRAFIRQYHWSFPVLADPNGTAGAAYRIPALPVTVIIDARGRISERRTGAQTVAELRSALAAAA